MIYQIYFLFRKRTTRWKEIDLHLNKHSFSWFVYHEDLWIEIEENKQIKFSSEEFFCLFYLVLYRCSIKRFFLSIRFFYDKRKKFIDNYDLWRRRVSIKTILLDKLDKTFSKKKREEYYWIKMNSMSLILSQRFEIFEFPKKKKSEKFEGWS